MKVKILQRTSDEDLVNPDYPDVPGAYSETKIYTEKSKGRKVTEPVEIYTNSKGKKDVR